MLLTKLLRGTDERRTRFHDAKGQLAVRSLQDGLDLAISAATCIARVLFDARLRVPWIALSALRFVQHRLRKDARVFEWGCGMSTLWYVQRCAEVHGVEDNLRWYEYLRERVPANTVHYVAGQQYVHAIDEYPAEYFDVVVIDGSSRLACFQRAPAHVKRGGLLVIDNSDADQKQQGDMYKIDQLLAASSEWDVHRFVGWAPSNFFAQETTVCVKL
jgi:hypothetical protein